MSIIGGRINRNPSELINYANSLEKSVETMENEIMNTIRALEIYATDLDAKSQEGIEKFKEHAKKIDAQFEEYKNLAKALRKNANAINDLIASRKF